MEKSRIGVYVCWCGTNIAMMVDVNAVAKEMESLPNVVLSKSYKYMCSDPGQEMIVKDIKQHKLNRVVVAACSPRIHENTFRKALESAGLNPYMLQMANIREQDSWVHSDRIEATRKAKSLLAGAIRRVNYHKPLTKREVPVNPATLVLGAGVAGISAALELADSGKKVFLIEKETKLGGIAAQLDLTYPNLYSIADTMESLIRRVEVHHNIRIYTNSTLSEIHGYVGNFEAVIKREEKRTKKIEFGNLIIAIGLKPVMDVPLQNLGHGFFKEVVTALEFEKTLKEGKIVTPYNIEPKNVAIIHCVGSRNENCKPYCSRTCCMTALKFSKLIRSALPETNIYHIYADMRSYGMGFEELYAENSKNNILFLMYDQQNGIPLVDKDQEGPGVVINFNELLSGEEVDVPADLVILMNGMEARGSAKKVGQIAGVSVDSNGFFIEKHPKLDPVATTTEGVYVVGSCQSPKDIPESVSQARAATARILAAISKGKVEVEVITAEVNEELCCGCQFCIDVCPYSANGFDPGKKISMVNEALCKGCGTCVAGCPSGAISSKHFTDQQIMAQIEGIMA